MFNYIFLKVGRVYNFYILSSFSKYQHYSFLTKTTLNLIIGLSLTIFFSSVLITHFKSLYFILFVVIIFSFFKFKNQEGKIFDIKKHNHKFILSISIIIILFFCYNNLIFQISMILILGAIFYVLTNPPGIQI